MLYAYKSTLVPDKPVEPLSVPKPGDPSLIRTEMEGTINGVIVAFVLDTGSDISALTPDDAKRAGLYPLQILKNTELQTAKGRSSEPIVQATMSLKGSQEFETVIGVDENLPYSLVSMGDLVKVFNVEFSSAGAKFTPLSRPFKQQQQQTVKKSRLGWSSGWI